MAIAYRTGTATTGQSAGPAVTIPSGVVAGDVMLLHMQAGAATVTTMPTGWTQIGSTQGGANPSVLMYKVAGSSDPGGSAAFVISSSGKWAIDVVAYSGVDTGTPIHVSSFVTESTTGTTHSSPSVSVTLSSCWAVFGVSDRSSPASSSFTISSGTVEQSAYNATTGAASIAVADSAGVVSTGTLPSRTWTGTASTANATMWTVVLAPATTTVTSVATYAYGQTPKALYDQCIAGSTSGVLTAYLLTGSYTPNLDTHVFVSDIIANEVATGNGYTAGGATLPSAAATYDAPSHTVKISSSSVTWTQSAGQTLTTAYIVIAIKKSTNATSPLVSLLDLGGAQNISGALQIAADPTLGWQYTVAN